MPVTIFPCCAQRAISALLQEYVPMGHGAGIIVERGILLTVNVPAAMVTAPSAGSGRMSRMGQIRKVALLIPQRARINTAYPATVSNAALIPTAPSAISAARMCVRLWQS